MSFLERFQRLVPPWLSSDEGGDVLASLSLMMDDYAARARLGLVARFPSFAPDDASLSAIGRDRGIIRGIGEPAAAYAARLVRAVDDRKTQGNPLAMLRQLRAYLQAPCIVRAVDRRGNWNTIERDGSEHVITNTANWNWDAIPASPYWARFWTIIYPVDGVTPWAPTARWGDSALWGTGKWGTPGATIGTTATSDQAASVRSIVRDWKPAGTTCEWIIIAFDEATFTPDGATDPASGWANWSDGAGNPVRLASARYWKGAST